ncbi:hypothetical protein [Bacillus sp. MMSF_3353]|uniref:hypothetical protein n=1 Tax=Bacillus TaxID=1386 RepID=UPI0035317357
MYEGILCDYCIIYGAIFIVESTPGLLEDLFIHVKETIQIQNMNQSIIKAPIKTEANGIDKKTLYMEAYVELINHKFVISELAVELSSVLKELNCFVQSSLPQLQSELDSQEPQSASL